MTEHEFEKWLEELGDRYGTKMLGLYNALIEESANAIFKTCKKKGDWSSVYIQGCCVESGCPFNESLAFEIQDAVKKLAIKEGIETGLRWYNDPAIYGDR